MLGNSLSSTILQALRLMSSPGRVSHSSRRHTHNDMPVLPGRGKGQIRQAKPKSSGAAALKRAATKRNNIRKHKKGN